MTVMAPVEFSEFRGLPESTRSGLEPTRLHRQPRSAWFNSGLCSRRQVDRPVRIWASVAGWLPGVRRFHLLFVYGCYARTLANDISIHVGRASRGDCRSRSLRNDSGVPSDD